MGSVVDILWLTLGFFSSLLIIPFSISRYGRVLVKDVHDSAYLAIVGSYPQNLWITVVIPRSQRIKPELMNYLSQNSFCIHTHII